jgi:hypothetical protein
MQEEKCSTALTNGHADEMDSAAEPIALVNKTPQLNNKTEDIMEKVMTNGSSHRMKLQRQESEGSAMMRKKKAAPPKLPPRTDSLNSLNAKRPLPPPPASQVCF